MLTRISQVIRESFNVADANDDDRMAQQGADPTPDYNPNEGDLVKINSGDHTGTIGHSYAQHGDFHSIMDKAGNHLGNFHSSNLIPHTDEDDFAPGGYTTTETGAAGAFNESRMYHNKGRYSVHGDKRIPANKKPLDPNATEKPEFKMAMDLINRAFQKAKPKEEPKPDDDKPIDEAVIVDFAARRAAKERNDLMNKIKNVVANHMYDARKLGYEYHRSGKLPLSIGTKLIHNREQLNNLPATITGHYVHPGDKELYGYDTEQDDRGTKYKSRIWINNPQYAGKIGIKSLQKQFEKDWTPLTGPKSIDEAVIVEDDGGCTTGSVMGGSAPTTQETTNTVGSGGIAGVGVYNPAGGPNQGEPGVNRKKKANALLLQLTRKKLTDGA